MKLSVLFFCYAVAISTVNGQMVVVGHVIDSRNRTIISGASVSIGNTSVACATVSSNDGFFYIDCPDKKTDAVLINATAPGYEVFKEVYNLGNRPISISLIKRSPDKELAKVINLNGTVLDQSKAPISGVSMLIDGVPNVIIDSEGKFIVPIKTTKNAIFISCNAEGFKPYSKWVNPGDASLEIVLERIPSPDKSYFTRADTMQILSDQHIIQNVLGDGCCEVHSEVYHTNLWNLKNRLMDYFSTDQLGALQSKPLESNLQDIILTLVRRTKGLPCTEEFVLTMELIDWLHQNEIVSWRFTNYDELHSISRSFLEEDLQSVRTTLSLLLMEGFKKTYLTNNYKHLRIRPGLFSRRKGFVDYKNRTKVFEYIIAASSDKSLNSNLYQAQSELIKSGKIQLPIQKLRGRWNWQFQIDQERLVVNYFKSRRKALRTTCANSPFKNKLLTVDSEEFKKLADEINRYRYKIGMYQSLLVTYDQPEIFDGYQSYGKGMQDYSTFIAAMTCQLFSQDQGCSESDALRWSKESMSVK